MAFLRLGEIHKSMIAEEHDKKSLTKCNRKNGALNPHKLRRKVKPF